MSYTAAKITISTTKSVSNTFYIPYQKRFAPDKYKNLFNSLCQEESNDPIPCLVPISYQFLFSRLERNKQLQTYIEREWSKQKTTPSSGNCDFE